MCLEFLRYKWVIECGIRLVYNSRLQPLAGLQEESTAVGSSLFVDVKMSEPDLVELLLLYTVVTTWYLLFFTNTCAAAVDN